MTGSVIADFGTPTDLESLFRDAYGILEEVQRAPEQVEAVSSILIQCHRTLSSLDRINQANIHIPGYSAGTIDDPYNLRMPLTKFIETSNAFSYMLNPVVQVALQGSDGCLPGPQWSWRRKQTRAVEQELASHQRSLSLLLTNAIYITTLEIQRLSLQHDPMITSILREVERRHRLFEGSETTGKESNTHKATRSRVQEIDWEFCQRRFFDYLDVWVKEQSSHPAVQRLSYAERPRRASYGASEPETYGSRRSITMDASMAYSSPRAFEEMDTSQFYRKPRSNRNSMRASSMTSATQPPPLVRSRPGGQSSSSKSSRTAITVSDAWEKTLDWSVSSPVIFSPTPITPLTTPITPAMPLLAPVPMPKIPTPIMSPAIVVETVAATSAEIPWEKLSGDTNGWLVVDIAREFPALRAAQRDIVRETASMSVPEARGYIQGRLAVLPPDAIRRIKDRLKEGSEEPQMRTPVIRSLTLPRKMIRPHSTEERLLAKSTKVAETLTLPRSADRPVSQQSPDTKSKFYAVNGNMFAMSPTIATTPLPAEKLKIPEPKLVIPEPKPSPSRTQSMLLSTFKKLTDSPPISPMTGSFSKDPLERAREQERQKREKRFTTTNLQTSPPTDMVRSQSLTITPTVVTSPVKPPIRAMSSLVSSQAKPLTRARGSFGGVLKEKSMMRPLSAISERPYTGKSWKSFRSKGSRTDMVIKELPADILNKELPALLSANSSQTSLMSDRPVRRSSETGKALTIARKSISSAQLSPILSPSITSVQPTSEAGGVSVTSLELVLEIPTTPPRTTKPASTEVNRSPLDKDLPPVPDCEKLVQLPSWLIHPSPLGSHPVAGHTSPTAAAVAAAVSRAAAELATPPAKPRRIAPESRKPDISRMSLPSTIKTARQVASARREQQSTSKLRMMTFHESVDKDLSAWLMALPYIEGGASPLRRN